MGYIVQYWDGSRESKEYKSKAEAVKAARLGLRDWMNDDDCIGQNDVCDFLFVIGGSEGPTDACAPIRKK